MPGQTTAPPGDWRAELGGLVDGYFSFNNNHPASGFNTLRNFEVKANQFSLNMTKLTLSHAADPVGFTIDLDFGRAWQHFMPPIQADRGSYSIFRRHM